MSQSLAGFAALGLLTYNKHQLKWAIDLGYQLTSLTIASDPATMQAGEMEVARARVLEEVARCYRTSGLAPPFERLLEDCENNLVVLYDTIIRNTAASHGKHICALVILGHLGGTLKFWSLYQRTSVPDSGFDFDGHWADIKHYCADLKLATDRLEGQLMLQNLNELEPRTFGDFLDSLRRPMIVLMLASNARDQRSLNIEEERRELENAIRQGRLKNSLEIRHVHSCRMRDITEALDQWMPTILHFSGHGSSTQIIVQDDAGLTVKMNGSALAAFLSTQNGLELVILNACCSRDYAQAIADSVGYAIAMEGTVSDKNCIAFTREFYRAVGNNYPLAEAFRRARNFVASTGSFNAHFLQGQRTEVRGVQGDIYPGLAGILEGYKPSHSVELDREYPRRIDAS